VSELIKNNDSDSATSPFYENSVLTNEQTCAGYKYENTYFTNDFDLDKELTTKEEGLPLAPDNDARLVVNPKYFSWHTDDGLEPFEPVLYKRTELAQKVYDNAGVSAAIGDRFLFTEQE
jgi:hypothetical protein